MNMPIESFKENGFCIVKNAISSELRDFVTQYALFDEMQSDGYRDKQVPNAYAKYGDPAMESMLLHLKTVLEENTGLTLHPTYSYYRVYKAGDVLKEHTDRPACEISVTVCFNFDYKELNGKYDWPIWMVDSPCVMEPGDGVIYHGCELNHWRDQFEVPNDAWHVQAFFHYVDANGPYADRQFDTRPFVGYKSQTAKPMSQITSNKKYITFTE
jgi:hypothetical protein